MTLFFICIFISILIFVFLRKNENKVEPNDYAHEDNESTESMDTSPDLGSSGFYLNQTDAAANGALGKIGGDDDGAGFNI